MCFASWSNTIRAEDFSTVNFESFNVTDGESYDEGLHGPLTCDTTAAGDYDAGTTPLGNAGSTGYPSAAAQFPNIYVRDDFGDGTTNAGVRYVVNRSDTTQWQFPYIRVRSAVNSTDVRGKVAFNYGGMNQGRFTFPVGNV